MLSMGLFTSKSERCWYFISSSEYSMVFWRILRWFSFFILLIPEIFCSLRKFFWALTFIIQPVLYIFFLPRATLRDIIVVGVLTLEKERRGFLSQTEISLLECPDSEGSWFMPSRNQRLLFSPKKDDRSEQEPSSSLKPSKGSRGSGCLKSESQQLSKSI